MDKFVIVHGSIFEGIKLIGPFERAVDAIHYAEEWLEGDVWEVAPVRPQHEDEESDNG